MFGFVGTRFMRTMLSIMALLSAGCATRGFNRGELKEQLSLETRSVNAGKQLNLARPLRLGIYFRTPQATRGMAQWSWTEQDRFIFEGIGNELKAQGLVSEVFPIVGSSVDGHDLKSVRLIAQKQQADAVLVVSGGAEVARFTNPWGWSYVLLLPTLFVPGSNASTLFLANATLMDVRDDALYWAAEAESTSTEGYPAAFGKEDSELMMEAKKQALLNLKTELVKKISRLQ